MEDEGYTLTLAGLLRKRGDLTAELESMRSRLEVTMAALDHLDATIRVFKPDIGLEDLPERPAPPAHAAFRGEVRRFLLDTLRAVGAPRTTSQMAEAVMAARRLNSGDRVLFKLVQTRTGNSLRALARKGFVEGHRYSKGAELEWRLTGRGGSTDPYVGWNNGSTVVKSARCDVPDDDDRR